MTSALSVPPTARNMDKVKLFLKLSTSKTARYHFNERPSGGNDSDDPAESPAKIIMKKGPIRYNSVVKIIKREAHVFPMLIYAFATRRSTTLAPKHMTIRMVAIIPADTKSFDTLTF